MKIFIAYEVPEQKFAEVQELVNASLLRDIDLNGVDLSVERGEYTCVEESKGEDSIDAARVLHAVQSVIDGSCDVQEGYGLTIFNVAYKK